MGSTWCGVMVFSVVTAASPMLFAQEGGMGGDATGGFGSDATGGFGGDATGGFGGDATGGFGGSGGSGGTGGQGAGGPLLVDVDGDGYANDVDCDDSRADVYPNAPVTCEDGSSNDFDQNCDGYVDYCDDNNYDDGGSVPLANLVGAALVGLWLGRSSWRR